MNKSAINTIKWFSKGITYNNNININENLHIISKIIYDNNKLFYPNSILAGNKAYKLLEESKISNCFINHFNINLCSDIEDNKIIIFINVDNYLETNVLSNKYRIKNKYIPPSKHPKSPNKIPQNNISVHE